MGVYIGDTAERNRVLNVMNPRQKEVSYDYWAIGYNPLKTLLNRLRHYPKGNKAIENHLRQKEDNGTKQIRGLRI